MEQGAQGSAAEAGVGSVQTGGDAASSLAHQEQTAVARMLLLTRSLWYDVIVCAQRAAQPSGAWHRRRIVSGFVSPDPRCRAA